MGMILSNTLFQTSVNLGLTCMARTGKENDGLPPGATSEERQSVRANRYGAPTLGARGRAPGRRTLTENLPPRRLLAENTAVPPAARLQGVPFPATETDAIDACFDPMAAPNAVCEDMQDPSALECVDGEDLSLVVGPLSPEERTRLVIDAKDRILAAYSDFGDACERNRHLVKEAADGGILEILFEIALGVLAPNFSKILQGIGKKIEQAIQPALLAALKKLQSQENVAALIAGVTFQTKESLKGEAKEALKARGSDKTEVDAFLTYLQDEAKAKYQDLGESLWNKTDEEILAAWAAFDAHILKFSDYVAAIKNLVNQFKKTVAPIGGPEEKTQGREPFDRSWTEQTTAVWVTDESDPQAASRMALVRRKMTSYPGLPGGPSSSDVDYAFKEWIPAELQNFAMAKALRISGGSDLESASLRQVGLR